MPSVACRRATVQFVPLVGDIGQAHVARSRRGQRPARRAQAVQRPLTGQHGRVQAALGTPDQHQLVPAPRGRREMAGLAPPGDAGHEGAFGLGEPAAQPFGHGQESVGGGAEQPFFWFALGQRLRGERGRGPGVATELGQIAAEQRRQGRDIDQEAGRDAGRRLERLIGPAGGRALSRVQERFDFLEVAAGGGHDRLRQQQPGTGPDHLVGQHRQPAVDGRGLAADVVDHIEVLLDDPGRPGRLAGGGRVADGVIGQPVPGVPGRGVAVQLRRASGLFFLQAGAEQVGEQVVIAPPAAHLIQRDQEQARPLGLLEQRLAALAAGDRVAQRAAEPLQHRGLPQERAQLLVLLLEHLLGQVVQDVPVAAGERGHERGGILVPAQRQRGQLQPGRPPLGPGRQRRHRRIRESRRRVLEQLGGLRGREPQLGLAYLGQLAAGPQPRQRQRRVAAAGQHHAYPGREPACRSPGAALIRPFHCPRWTAFPFPVLFSSKQPSPTRGGQFVDQGRHQ